MLKIFLSLIDKNQDEQPDTLDLESEESTEKRKNQEEEGLKILTADQMLGKLPIF